MNEEELDFELEVRDIVFSKDDSMSRKRRALREKMKKEKEEQDSGIRTMKRNPEEELRICEMKLQEFELTLGEVTSTLPPRCQSILLHLGNRVRLLRQCLGLEAKAQIDNILGKILKYLEEHFYNKSPARNQGNSELGLTKLFEVIQTTDESRVCGIGTITIEMLTDSSPT